MAESKYREKYCDEIIKHCARGLSVQAFAGVIGVAKSTLNMWIDTIPEFKESVDIATEKYRLFLENVGRNGMMGVRKITVDGKTETLGNFNGGMWQFIARNRFPQEWKDKKEIDATVSSKFSPEAEEETDKILRSVGIDPETLQKINDDE